MMLMEAVGACAQGCSAQRLPVCGADGLTYLNRCLAECQQVEVASPGACHACEGVFGGKGTQH